MQRFEYKVVPAPKKGQRGKGVKGADGRFAHALEQLMNENAALGWEYQRTDTLPAEERSGLASRTTVYQNMLVFRRETQAARSAHAPVAADPVVAAPVVAPVVAAAAVAPAAAVSAADLIPDEQLDEILSELEASAPKEEEPTAH
ncbi:MAG: DUF4177 domain-containing protein [Paracoccaceae bacterium]